MPLETYAWAGLHLSTQGPHSYQYSHPTALRLGTSQWSCPSLPQLRQAQTQQGREMRHTLRAKRLLLLRLRGLLLSAARHTSRPAARVIDCPADASRNCHGVAGCRRTAHRGCGAANRSHVAENVPKALHRRGVATQRRLVLPWARRACALRIPPPYRVDSARRRSSLRMRVSVAAAAAVHAALPASATGRLHHARPRAACVPPRCAGNACARARCDNGRVCKSHSGSRA